MLLVGPILIILALVLVAAFFSAGELGIMTLSRIRIESEARRGSVIARMQLSLREHPQRFLSTILIGYNVANITLATYSAKLSLDYFTAAGYSEETALAISTVVMTVVIVIFAELVPKTYAALNPERLGAIVTAPLYYLDKLFTPLNWLFERVVNPLLALLSGGRPHRAHTPERAEVLTAVSMALAGGELHEVDARVAQEALHFSMLSLRDVMTPRVDVTGVPDGATLGDALKLMKQTGYSRLPVFHEDLDEIVGVLLIKDMVGVLAEEAEGLRPREWFKAPVTGHLREVSYFPEGKSVVEALGEIRTMRSHMAVVVDEHGGTAGIVTLEDMLEELVGDIRDESDPDHSADIVARGDGYVIVTGRARLDSLPELADLDLDPDSTSIGGLLMERLGRTVNVGDVIEIGPIKLTALKMQRNRVKLVRIDYPSKEETVIEE